MINQGFVTDSDTEKELKKWQQARTTAVDEDKLKQQYKNRLNNAQGQHFEREILAGCRMYESHGIATIDKTPEPFRVTSKNHRTGEFTGRFSTHAQPDFQGTLYGGRSIMFEAKRTSKDRITRNVLTDTQMDVLEKHSRLGALCGVCICIQDKTLTDVMQLGANGNIAVVPANMTLLTANLEVIKNEEIDQVTILSKELEKVKDVFDYCIIDCPPDINISVINALVAADEVIIPIKIDGYAFDGMKELEEQINNAKQLNPKLKFRGCLVTMFYNRDVCRQGEEYLQNQRYPVFRTHIRRTEKADEVTFTTQSLMQYSPRSGAARDYKTFVKEYLEG